MIPALPVGLAARPLADDDATAVAALLAAAEPADDTGEYPDAEDVAEWWHVTGALRLYEGLGFRPVRSRVSWSRSLSASPERA